MPQIRVKTPQGVVEFPEGTSEADMAAALKQLEPQPPGAVERFAQSAWDQLNPITAVKGLWQAAMHPIDTVIDAGNASFAKRDQAITQAQAGQWGDALVSTVGSAPLIGQPIELGINQARAGDYAGALGTAVGLAVPYTRPLKMLGRGSIALGNAMIPQRMAAASSRLRGIAESTLAEVMSPTVGANKVRIANDAAKVAPVILERNMANVWSREGLHDNVRVGLTRAATALDDAADARQSWKSYPTKDVVDALETAKRDVQGEAIQASKWPRTVDPDTGLPITEPYGQNATPHPVRQQVANIDHAIAEVKALGETATYDALRKIRSGWDKEAGTVYSSAVTPEYIKNVSGQMGAADVTGVIREYLAGQDPVTAVANLEYSLMRRADRVLQAVAEVERARPNRGGRIMSRVSASLVGSQVAGLMGAIVGYFVAPAAEVSIGMGMTPKLKLLARPMQQLSDAIRAGHVSGIDFYSRQIRRTLAQAGIMIENQKDPNNVMMPSHAPTR